MKRLFIIGNGFDLEHGLPTRYNPDFKRIAEMNEQNSSFWEIYQSRRPNIWADFEHCLANPDFNELEEIYEGYAPDYTSDHESDRNAIIFQVDLNGLLMEELYEFAEQAEFEIDSSNQIKKYLNTFQEEDLFLSFNYTHTLEKKYNIKQYNILHIHGEVGKDNLILGYPDGEYEPEKYYYDARHKGRGPYIEVDFEEHINKLYENEEIDYYTYTAYTLLINKVKSFIKEPKIEYLKLFLEDKQFDQIIVLGHSCAIDIEYFDYINNKYPTAKWVFSPFNPETKNNIDKLIKDLKISNHNMN